MVLGALVTGFVIAGGSTPAWQKGHLNGFGRFILAGAELNMAYMPYHSLLFERVIALFCEPDNAGYLIKYAIHGSTRPIVTVHAGFQSRRDQMGCRRLPMGSWMSLMSRFASLYENHLNQTPYQRRGCR